MASIEEQKEWKKFRQALDKKDRKVFDGMFSICHLYFTWVWMAAAAERTKKMKFITGVTACCRRQGTD
jgi:alkanesulfonate monooxygenase SsuD/methylene tetrahydromethanopterin reductase-like flavin-dependent oxidoreductase (luciferase family)